MKDDAERILAIDYGEKRIGLAISDPLKLFAIPLITLKNNSSIFNEFKKIFSNYNFIKVIIGYPLKENGSKTKLTPQIEEFKKKISLQYNIITEFVDERYSSSIAWEQIKESVTSKKKRRDKSLIDKNAAAVILKDYLENL